MEGPVAARAGRGRTAPTSTNKRKDRRTNWAHLGRGGRGNCALFILVTIASLRRLWLSRLFHKTGASGGREALRGEGAPQGGARGRRRGRRGRGASSPGRGTPAPRGPGRADRRGGGRRARGRVRRGPGREAASPGSQAGGARRRRRHNSAGCHRRGSCREDGVPAWRPAAESASRQCATPRLPH